MNSKTLDIDQAVSKDIIEYFNFLSSGDIRLKNSRIGIETILYEYIDCGRSPEKIAQIYNSITLEQVYAIGDKLRLKVFCQEAFGELWKKNWSDPR